MSGLDALNVTKIYKGSKQPVLNQVSLSIASGECFALLGMNGAGKTTLIRAFLNLTAVDQGKLLVGGQEAQMQQARQLVAYLPERFLPHEWLKARDYIYWVLQMHGVVWVASEVADALRDVGLASDVLDRSMGECSKGMCQKIGLVAAFLSRRQVLILDEPMTGLDPLARVQVRALIRRMKDEGRTVLMCTHALNDVAELAHRLAVMHDGCLRFVGTIEEWLAHYKVDNLEQAYLATVGDQSINT